MDTVVSGAAKVFEVIAVLLLPACAHYVKPSRPANFGTLTNNGNSGSKTNSGIANNDAITAKPEANFRANIDVVRIQAPGYKSYGAESYADGDFSVVTVWEFEEDSHFNRPLAMLKVAGVAPLNRLLIPPKVRGSQRLAKRRPSLMPTSCWFIRSTPDSSISRSPRRSR